VNRLLTGRLAAFFVFATAGSEPFPIVTHRKCQVGHSVIHDSEDWAVAGTEGSFFIICMDYKACECVCDWLCGSDRLDVWSGAVLCVP